MGAVLAPAVARADPMPAERVRYDGHRVVRAWPADAAELAEVLAVADDVWTERVGPGPVDVRLSPQSLAALDATGIDYDVRISDVQLAVDAEHDRLAVPEGTAQAPGAWFSDFKDGPEIDQFMDALAAEFPDRVTVENVGSSLDGRLIRGVRISGAPAEGKAALILTGTLHAREWLSPMTVTCIADTLAREYGSDPQITDALDALEIFVVPVVNPDGYAYTWSGDRYWRKNTRGGHGVDLNRNFSFQWGGGGSSGDVSAEDYRGNGPLSEPESQALNAYFQTKPNAVAHIDFHSFSELILYPWGYQYGAAPDEADLSELAQDMSSAIQATHGAYYDPIQGSDLYPADGVIDDWAYAEFGMMSFTIELRGSDFVVPASQILPSCEENLEATLVLAAHAMQFSDPTPSADGGVGEDEGSGDGGPGADGGGTLGGDESGDGGDGGGGDSSGDAGFSDDADETGALGEDGQALPAAYGRGAQPETCACRGGTSAPPLPALLCLFALVSRRRR